MRYQGRIRLFLLLIGFCVVFTVIAARLAWIQVLHRKSYVAYANSEDIRTITPPALRGSILASNGDELAMSEMRPTVYADPHEVNHPASEARGLAPVLGLSSRRLQTKLSEDNGYVVLAQDVANKASAAVTKLDLAGIALEQTPERLYPAGQLAAPLLGSLNAAGQGASGLEYEYNKLLNGTPGHVVEHVDPEGQPLPSGTIRNDPATLGDDLVLSINEPLQYQTEQALKHAVVKTRAISGTAIVMDRTTGQLLAVADITAGPNGATTESSTASAFTQVYEPGSVAKLITVAAALNQRLIGPRQTFTIPPALPVAGTLIHDDESHPTEQLSVTGILAQSSNIGAAEIAERLGPSTLYHYEQAFGFTSRTPVDFPGESAGLVPTPAQFSGTTLATMAYGEAQAITPAQLVAAYNTIANGGVYVAPRLVNGLIGPNGHEHLLATPAPHRIVSQSVASDMTPMFEQVVSSGTGTNAKVNSYAIAGKTGTSNTVRSKGGYSRVETNSTFVGYYPAQHPAVTQVVVMYGTALYGAEAAAPVFSAIARDVISDFDISSFGPQPRAQATAVPTVDGHVETSLIGQ